MLKIFEDIFVWEAGALITYLVLVTCSVKWESNHVFWESNMITTIMFVRVGSM